MKSGKRKAEIGRSPNKNLPGKVDARDNYSHILAKLFHSPFSIFHSALLIVVFAISVFAQPRVLKVDPPSWWTESTINPVRVLVKGDDLKDANVLVPKDSRLRASNFKASDNGHYLFFDLAIDPKTKPGKYKLKITKSGGIADLDFEVLPKGDATGKYQGFSTDDVIYMLMPDRFADGDPSNNDPARSKGLYDRSKPRSYHGGDLKGVIDKLPYLKSLGVTAIWTTPIYDNNDRPDTKEVYNGETYTTGYHGYGAVDMYSVDEHFGDVAKLQELVQKAHSLGIKMIQDQVANHTGPYHPWADDPPTPTWWNGTVKNHISNNWQKWTAMNSRASYQTQKSNLEGWFIDILPDFNQHDPEVERYLIQNSIWWIRIAGYDAIRMDTLPHVPREFWAKWSSAIKREYPKVNILGEIFDGDPALLSYFQTGRKGSDGIDTGIDTLYDFTLFYAIRNAFARGGEVRQVSQALAHDWMYPNAQVLSTFIGVHDMERFMNEPGATTDGLKLAQTLIMTSRGTPILYYGDEIAMAGGGDPDNRRDFPGGFPADGIDKFQSANLTGKERDVRDHVTKLGEIRQHSEALRRGASIDLLEQPQQMAYARATKAEALIVVINNDDKPAKVSFSISDLKQLPSDCILVDALQKLPDVHIKDGTFTANIPARTAGIFRRNIVITF